MKYNIKYQIKNQDSKITTITIKNLKERKLKKDKKKKLKPNIKNQLETKLLEETEIRYKHLLLYKVLKPHLNI